MLARLPRPTVHRATIEWVPAVVDFLRDVAAPQMPHQPNWFKVDMIVRRVIGQHVALLALDGDRRIVSSLGIAPMFYWWCDVALLGNVWFFTRRESRAGAVLIRIAAHHAQQTGAELHIQSEKRRSLSIFNDPGW